MSITFVLEALVVLGAIVMGTRAGGVGVGLWGGLGVFVLVFIFREPPGEPPAAALAIILAVILAAATMQVAGGIDWMVVDGGQGDREPPKQVTIIAPLMSFLFCLGAGTGNIVYPLLPVIYDVSYRQKIRPERPLSMTVVASGIALACSPVSAAMAAMITLTDVAPYNFSMIEVLSVTIPAALIGIFVTSLVDEPVRQGPRGRPRVPGPDRRRPARRTAAGPRASGRSSPTPRTGRNAAFIFLVGVVTIVIFGLFPDIRPRSRARTAPEPIGVTRRSSRW